MNTFAKDPDATLDYMIDWTRWLGNDTIQSSEWFVPDGLTKTQEAAGDRTATVWLAGGTVGNTYAVTNRITTFGGRVQDQTIRIDVVSL